jgi:autotransporter-associated beta strand protein
MARENQMIRSKHSRAVLAVAVAAVGLPGVSARATITPTYVGTAGTQTAYDSNAIAAAGAGDLILNGGSTLSSVAAPATNSGFGTVGFYDGSVASTSNFSYYANTGTGSLPQTYVFDLSNSASVGYDLTTIQSVGGWSDHSLGNQSFNVFIMTVANPTFTQLGGTYTNAPYTTTAADSTMTTINDSTGVLASGVTAIEFQLLSPNATVQTSNGGSVYRDVAVLGSATPVFDANTASSGAQDGAGVWNTTTADFYNSATNSDQVWSNSTNELAAFGNGGSAGVVTVGTVNANAIQFNNVTGGYNLTGGTITLGGISPTISTNSASAIIGSNLVSTSLNTTGAGNLMLTGAVTLSAVTFVESGSLTIAGAGSINSSALIGVGGQAGNVAVLNINTTGTVSFSSAGTTAINTIGCQPGGLGVVNQTSGNVQIGGDIALGYVSTTASGTYNLTGTGNLNVQSPNPGIVVAWGGTGSLYQSGNSNLNDAGYLYIGGNDGASGASGVATFSGGTATVGNTSSGAWATNLGFNANSTGVLNIGTEAGGHAVFTIVNGGINVGDASGATAILNLNSGVFALGSYFIQKMSGTNSTLNLNGGTMRVVSNSVATLVNPSASPTVVLYNGGLTVDTNSFNTTLAVPLTPATGGGVYEAGGIIPTGGFSSGLTGTPIVTVTGGGGTGLTAIADVSGGVVTGFELTSPGQNYVAGQTVTFSISGAGASGTTTFTHLLGSSEITANGTGGLTKIGVGKLTLLAANTYTGATDITAGTLALGVSGAIGSSSNIVMGPNTTLYTGGSSDAVGTLSQAGNTTIDFGAANTGSILHFTASGSQSWAGTLTIADWNGTAVTGGGADQLYFGSNATGLTPSELSDIKFTGYTGPAAILSNGEVVPASSMKTATHPMTQAMPTIMPLGDSITYGQSGNNGTLSYPGGYRDPLYSNLHSAGYQFNFVGTENANSTTQLTNANESLQQGEIGYRIDQLTSNLDSYLSSSNRANTILLMIGTNDVTQQYDPNPSGKGFAADAASRLITLISAIYSDSPGATIYVSSIIPILNTSEYASSRWSPAISADAVQYNSLIQSEVVPEFLAQGDSIYFVDNYSAFLNPDGSPDLADYGSNDDEHPSPAGYAVMGQTWFNAILSSVPEPGSISLAISAASAGLLSRRRRRS